MAYAYMLRCADGSTYVGSTLDLERRLSQHNLGKGSAYTRRPGRRPVVIVWSHQCSHIAEAFALEKQVQGWSREKREALAAGELERLPGLARKDLGARSDWYPALNDPDVVG